MPGHDKLVGDIKEIVNDAIKPVRQDLADKPARHELADLEKRLTDRFNQGFEDLKKLIIGNRPIPPQP